MSNMPAKEVLERVYGESKRSGERFLHLSECFAKHFGDAEVEFFTSPGRTEMIGNHTDHNGGKSQYQPGYHWSGGAEWNRDNPYFKRRIRYDRSGN